MAKTDFKALMLARGEKFLLIGALAIGALLLLWGVLSAAQKGDPAADKSALDNGVRNIRNKLSSQDAPPTDPNSKKPLPEYTPIPREQFQVADSKPFDQTVWPDRYRQLPDALAPIDSQIDLFLVSIRKQARDNFVRDEDGNILDFTAQWITQLVDTKIDPKSIKKDLEDSIRAQKGGKPRKSGNNPPPGGNLPPGGSPPGGGRNGGGASMPPGMGGGGFSGEEGMQGYYQPGQMASKKTSETVVEWKKLSEVLEGRQAALPAYGVFPTRMAIVNLSYPLEEQLKEIQRALRLPTLRHAIAETSPERLFATDPDTGKIVPYSTLSTGGVGGGTPGGIGGNPGGLPGVPPGSPPGMQGGLPGMPRGSGAGIPGVPPGSGPGEFGEGGTGPTLTANALAAPVFAGFIVQRRKIVQGEVGDWEDFDHADRYYNEFTLYDAPVKPDTGYLPYFLRPDQGLAAPIPQIAPNWTSAPQLAPGEAEPPKEKHYPEFVRMPSIVADFEALQKILKPIRKKDALAQYKKNSINPYNVGSGRLGSGNIPGIPGLGGSEEEGSGVLGSFNVPPRGQGDGGQPEQGNGMGTGDPTKSPLAVKNMLIRFLDTDLLPGVSYQYQVKVKLRNPNFNKKKDVADEKQAEIEFIESRYFQCKQTLKVPGESYIYAGSIKEYEKNVTDLQDQLKKSNNDKVGLVAPDRLNKLFETQAVKEGKRAVVQMQKWVYSASFGSEEERIGAWVEADIAVAQGEYIGRRTLVELPLWKASLGKYQLTPTTKPLVTQWPKEVLHQPVGRPVDFRTRHVLLDFEGGRVKTRVDDRVVEDEAATELLIFREDGKLEVRKELADAEVPERMVRDKNWKDWIAEVRKQSELNNGTTGPGGIDPGRGGGTPGSPPGGAGR